MLIEVILASAPAKAAKKIVSALLKYKKQTADASNESKTHEKAAE
jgi:hypothetical protein